MVVTPPRVCGDSGGKRKDGTPCGANVPEGALLCPHHDPAQAEEMARRRDKGNRSRSAMAVRAKAAAIDGVPDAPQDLEQLVPYTAWVLTEHAHGRMGKFDADVQGRLLAVQARLIKERDYLREIKRLRAELADARKDAPKAALGLHRG